MAKPCRPHLITRKGYATSVRQQSCQRLCNAQRVQLFEIKTANVRGQGVRPLAFLWGFQRGYSLWKENTPFAPAARTPHTPRAPGARKKLPLTGKVRNILMIFKKSGPPEWLLVCLGNYGKEYENTRQDRKSVV